MPRLCRKPRIPYPANKKGSCKWCGEPIIEFGKLNARKSWHTECVEVYRAAAFSYDMRKALAKRDKCVCAGCGALVPNGEWHADHIVPLWAQGSHLMDNLQTLCHACHKVKTAKEAADRARLKKGVA